MGTSTADLLEFLDPGQQGLAKPHHPWRMEVAAGKILLAVLRLCLWPSREAPSKEKIMREGRESFHGI